jgi:hypothetical protein
VFTTFVRTLCSFARSFISRVDNARELQASIVAEEASDWCCVWDKDTCMDWGTYMHSTLAGKLLGTQATLMPSCCCQRGQLTL